MSQGCRVSIMSGIIKDEPLPSTKVGDLRINHVYLDISFDSAIQINNPDHKNNKLIASHLTVENSFLHIEVLLYLIEKGVELVKVHQVCEFNQSKFLEKHRNEWSTTS